MWCILILVLRGFSEADLPLCQSGFENYDGEWVYDEDVKMQYKTNNARFAVKNDVLLDANSQTAAQLWNRTSEAVKWKWRSRKCRYLHLLRERESFIKRMSGKSILLVGDSVMGEVFTSLSSILGANLSTGRLSECRKLVHQTVKDCKGDLGGFMHGQFCVFEKPQCKMKSFTLRDKTNTHIVHVHFWRSDVFGMWAWAHDYLFRDNENILSRMWSSLSNYNRFDVILFESGLHWHVGKDKQEKDRDFSLYKIFSKRVSEVFADVFAGSTLILMPMWQPNYNCMHATEPMKSIAQYWENKSSWDHYNWMYLQDFSRVFINAWENRSESLYTLNTAPLSINPLGRVGNTDGKVDCLHSLLPGIYDIIGDWLWTLLESIYRESGED